MSRPPHEILDLFAEDSWRNAYAGALEVRPPGEPGKLDGRNGKTYGIVQVKFAASSVLAVPLYEATWGYGQRGRVRSILASVRCAMIRSGACRVSSQVIGGSIASHHALYGLAGVT